MVVLSLLSSNKTQCLTGIWKNGLIKRNHLLTKTLELIKESFYFFTDLKNCKLQ